MLEIGQLNTLRVARESDIGLYLDDGQSGQILLPKRYVAKGTQLDDEIEVFIYPDSEDRLVAITDFPKAMVDECAWLKVVERTPVGAFLDWGLPKDLLLPFNEQEKQIEPGDYCAVVVALDDATDRIYASTRLRDYLDEEADDSLKEGQEVGLLICGKTPLGFKAVIDHDFIGVLYENEVFQDIKPGDQVKGYIKAIREDGRIDLRLDAGKKDTVSTLMDSILEKLKGDGGESTITDKSTPAEISKAYGVSKANYKRALGRLYKARQIVISPKKITLVDKD